VRDAQRLRRARWIAIRAGEADIEDTPEVFFFCPECAELAFG
jgi:hypothetical protein